MNFELKEVLSLAKMEFELNNHSSIGPLHMLMGVLTQSNGIGCKILALLDVNIPDLIAKVNDELSLLLEDESFDPKSLKTNKAAKKILIDVNVISYEKEEDMSVEILICAFFKSENKVKYILEELGVTEDEVDNIVTQNTREQIESKYIKKESTKIDFYNMIKGNDFDEERFSVRKNKKNDMPILNGFGTNLNDLALEGKLQEVIGREKEIERLMVVLMRKTKKNPLILGDAGVGKSAIIEGLAIKIIKGDTHEFFRKKQIYSIDLASMVAGTKFRGEFEERLKGLIKELKANPDIIIFIDELHQLIGSGSTQGTMDGANIIKPELSRGDIQVIGATTFSEYKEHISKDGAISRRFQNISLVEPTEKETVEILNGIKYKYEAYHNVILNDEVIKNAVRMSAKYISTKKFPDKAIDVVDEVSAMVNFKNIVKKDEFKGIKKRLEELETKEKEATELMKESAKNSDFEKAAEIRDQKGIIQKKIREVKSEMDTMFSEVKKSSPIEVTDEHVSEVIEMMTGVPVKTLDETNIDYLLKLEEKLNAKVIGQKTAVETMCQGIIRQKTGIKDPNKPLVYLFLGPTGIGKTLLVKEIAKEVYGSESNFIRINMSDYQDAYTVSNLTGSAKGYVGSESGSYLYEKVKHNPNSIILLDEVEKAHANIFNAFLQIFDEGQAVTNDGEVISFKETIIVMTSNLGVREANDSQKSFNMFTSENKTNKANIAYDKALKSKFSPEVLNRITKIVTFNSIQKENAMDIAMIELERLIKRVNKLGKELKIKKGVYEHLSEKGFSIEYGARFLNRTIEQDIEIPLSYYILKSPTKNTISVEVKNGEINFK